LLNGLLDGSFNGSFTGSSALAKSIDSSRSAQVDRRRRADIAPKRNKVRVLIRVWRGFSCDCDASHADRMKLGAIGVQSLIFRQAWRQSRCASSSPWRGRKARGEKTGAAALSLIIRRCRMRIFVPVVAATALLGAISAAFAADATGAIKSLNMTTDMVTLDNGSTYVAPKSVSLSNFKVGQKVMIKYAKTGGKMDITSIKPVG
jgi:hypothetical protein